MVYRSPVSRSAKRPWSSLDRQKVGRREPSACAGVVSTSLPRWKRVDL